VVGGFSHYRVSDTFGHRRHHPTRKYYSQANKSWRFFNSVPVKSSSPASVNFNGKWIQQKFNGANLGYRPKGFIGYTTIFANPNTLFVSAGAEGYGGSLLSGGKVLILTRNAEGLWEPSIDLIGSGGLVGLGFGINDYDIIAGSVASTELGLSIRFFAAPISCFTQPLQESTSQRLL
jgi:hypothetical protein